MPIKPKKKDPITKITADSEKRLKDSADKYAAKLDMTSEEVRTAYMKDSFRNPDATNGISTINGSIGGGKPNAQKERKKIKSTVNSIAKK